MKIIGAQLFPIRLPFTKAIGNAQGIVEERRGTLLRLAVDSGAAGGGRIEGWGEASPYPGFGLESLNGSRTVLASAARELLGNEIAAGARAELGSRIIELTMSSSCARAALETAVLDVLAKTKRQPLFELLGSTNARDPLPLEIECNALVTGDDLDTLERSARTEHANGFRSFKLKVAATTLERDLARVARLREVVGADAEIRLDANQGYSKGDALPALEAFARYRIEYLEQPLAAPLLRDMAELREKSPVPLAADEAAVTEADALRVIDAGAADLIVIKPSALGGPSASLRIAVAARRAGLRVVVTSLLDSAIGVSAAHHVAIAIASQGELPACGLATGALLARDVADFESPVAGCLPYPELPGLGVEMDESRVRRCSDGPIVDLRP